MLGSRHHSFETLAIALVALIALAACSPSNSADDGTFSPTIAGDAPAGLEVSIPLNALPDGVAPEDIEITSLPIETSEERETTSAGPPEFALSFSPDGLKLDEPITVSVPVDINQPAALLALHQSGDSFESPEITVVESDGGFSAQMTIEHFSTLVFISPGSLSLMTAFENSAEASVTPRAAQALVGDELLVDLNVTAPSAEPVTTRGWFYVFDLEPRPDHPETAAPPGAQIGTTHDQPVVVEVLVPAGRRHTLLFLELKASGPVSPERDTVSRRISLASSETWTPEDPVVFTCEDLGEVAFEFSALGRVSALATVTSAADSRVEGLDANILVLYSVRRDASGPDAECVTSIATPAPTPTPVSAPTVTLTALFIGNAHYPVEQFYTALPLDDACDFTHWHAAGPVFSIEGTRDDPTGGTSIEDEDPDGCGFGTVTAVPSFEIDVLETEFRNYRDIMAGS